MPRMKNKARSDGRLQSRVYLGDGKYKYVYAATQKELAEKAGISQSFLCDIEQGRCKPSIDTAVKLAQVLDVSDIAFWSAK